MAENNVKVRIDGTAIYNISVQQRNSVCPPVYNSFCPTVLFLESVVGGHSLVPTYDSEHLQPGWTLEQMMLFFLKLHKDEREAICELRSQVGERHDFSATTIIQQVQSHESKASTLFLQLEAAMGKIANLQERIAQLETLVTKENRLTLEANSL